MLFICYLHIRLNSLIRFDEREGNASFLLDLNERFAQVCLMILAKLG